MKKLLMMTSVVAMVVALPVRAMGNEIFVDTFDLSGATCGFGLRHREYKMEVLW